MIAGWDVARPYLAVVDPKAINTLDAHAVTAPDVLRVEILRRVSKTAT